ncbi:MAG: hypothetical protein AVDCRST_MAG91-530, partial [uncultured Sphingomonadaceae bacterium]
GKAVGHPRPGAVLRRGPAGDARDRRALQPAPLDGPEVAAPPRRGRHLVRRADQPALGRR